MILRIAVLTLPLTGILIACAAAPEAVGRRIYNDNCTVCHGASARGVGPISAEFDREVPDLTLIAQRNGGTFPMIDVMNTIDGYLRSREGTTIMPEFGADLAEGPLVHVDMGDGTRTRSPSRLVAIAEYLRSIQR